MQALKNSRTQYHSIMKSAQLELTCGVGHRANLIMAQGNFPRLSGLVGNIGRATSLSSNTFQKQSISICLGTKVDYSCLNAAGWSDRVVSLVTLAFGGAREPLGNKPSKRVQACSLLGMNNFWGI